MSERIAESASGDRGGMTSLMSPRARRISANSGHPLFARCEMSERIEKGASGDRARRFPYALLESKLPDFIKKRPFSVENGRFSHDFNRFR